ncbi:FlhC family transcriptional regulator [Acidovorax sp. sic0104]|uniref:FlhC family transcriptional regulator n=1 Tax=Acidovorax sp. sic0104 TaxID=2854784 RepID=UPI001C4943A1|nr:FlhC family transcriptional regulator [Acidovorax sp. sic0104]MBV7542130.1 hypothetical protein [Acidovorax sp. sic0104]
MADLSTLENIARYQAASQLISGRLRLSLVQSLTGISIRPLRAMWEEIHGEGASSGKLPHGVLSFMVNQTAAVGLSTFASMYLRQNHSGGKVALTAKGLLGTWGAYQKFCGPLDLNAGYYAAQDVMGDTVSFPKCGGCGVHFIYDRGSTLTSRCPYCGLAPTKYK